jgi:hypothetical protein
MSMVNKCTVCDEPVNPYGGETRCGRCCQPCPTCRGDVMLCKHPLPERADLEAEGTAERPLTRWQHEQAHPRPRSRLNAPANIRGVQIHCDFDQGSTRGSQARCGLLTASEFDRIITPTLKVADNVKSRAHLWEMAAQRISGYVEPQYISDAMLRGHRGRNAPARTIPSASRRSRSAASSPTTNGASRSAARLTGWSATTA